MNDFQSTCTQYFDSTSTTNELEVERYANLQLVSVRLNLMCLVEKRYKFHLLTFSFQKIWPVNFLLYNVDKYCI